VEIAIGVSTRLVLVTFSEDVEPIVRKIFSLSRSYNTPHEVKLVWGYTNTGGRILLLFHILVNCRRLNAGQQLS
jgi:hypothetical protein